MPEEKKVNRLGVTTCVVLVTMLQSLDATIANVALPHMQGTMSATQEQINWVLTSYILASAIMMPPSGFLASRFGERRVLLCAVAGFVFMSGCCGFAQTLPQIVLFRALQGLFGAPLIPLSQSIMFNTVPASQRGVAMAWWGVAAMVAPAVGPIAGGWLTDNFDWRWVFFINLPIGIIALTGMALWLENARGNRAVKLDWFGFGTLSLGIASLQIMLDRGELLDWFSSREIVIEALVSGSAFYLFLTHISTTDNPFIRPAMFRNRTYACGVLFTAVIGVAYLSSMSLLAPYLEVMMNYPTMDAGLVMGPRGLGMMIAMLVIGRMMGRIDARPFMAIGTAMAAYSLFEMTTWTPDVSGATVGFNGAVQGASLGFVLGPLSTITLSSLPVNQVAQGAGLYSLSRNIGSSVGISVVNSLLTRNIQINHAEIVRNVTAVNPALNDPAIHQFWNATSAAGRAALDAMVTRQALIIAYADDFKLLTLALLSMVPVVFVLKKTILGTKSDQQAVTVE